MDTANLLRGLDRMERKMGREEESIKQSSEQPSKEAKKTSSLAKLFRLRP